MRKLVVLSFMYLVSTSLLPAQVSIPLYDQVPNSKPSVNKEKSEISGRILVVSNVSIPSLTMYSPAGYRRRKTHRGDHLSGRRVMVLWLPGMKEAM
jgi:hypothetical protein